LPTYSYTAVVARQASGQVVVAFAAPPQEILDFAQIDRVARTSNGSLRGFQRHQIASHIKEIRDYLSRADALLPNPVVIAFTEGVRVSPVSEGVVRVEIDGEGKPGYVVDGQQRLTALSGIDKPGFQVFVSALLCEDYNALRQQFVLINNTRPLPKALIYELLPTVTGLPERFTARSFAAALVELLNYDERSSLHYQIYQHTNPGGVIRDTAMQKVAMNSASDGAVREFVSEPDYLDRSLHLFSNFFGAVQDIFRPEWQGMTPKTSRLVHGAGVVALGFVMDLLYSSTGASTREDFKTGLRHLQGKTAWTSGKWRFSDGDERPWNAIQNTPGDIALLTEYLVRETRRGLRRSRTAAVDAAA
jgi:DGQHR domain-containing protein